MPDGSLLHAVTLALGDPGSFVGRDTDEPLPDWKARAVLAAVTPFLAKPAALDDSDRPHVEEARRVLASYSAGRGLLAPRIYGSERALYDAGRTLLDLLDKLAPRGEAGG